MTRTRFEWTAQLDQQLRTLAADGLPVREMARRIGTSSSVLQRRLNHLGISGGGDRSQTEAATRARITDAKAKRAALLVDLLDDAQRLRKQLWEPSLVFNFGGKDNTYEERTHDKPTYSDQLKIMQATGAAIDRSIKLNEVDSDGAEAVRSLLVGLAEKFGLIPDGAPQ